MPDLHTAQQLETIALEIKACTLCPLHASRTIAVPGTGPAHHPRLCIIGEAPGRQEDQAGLPFVGQAGRLLNEVLEEAGFEREKIFITNIVKCRPPQNRIPAKGEVKTCVTTYLQRQLALLQPPMICLLGRTAATALLGVTKLTEVRGMVVEKNGYHFFTTLHPAAVLRNGELLPSFRDDIMTLSRYTKSKINK